MTERAQSLVANKRTLPTPCGLRHPHGLPVQVRACAGVRRFRVRCVPDDRRLSLS